MMRGMADDIVRVAQLSDTHFLTDADDAEGGFAYDTAAAFEAVLADLDGGEALDLVCVTGDIADHGRAPQYARAAEAFARLPAPVNVCPGNHDQQLAFGAGMGRPGVGTSRVIETGVWCFLFVDSNAGVMTVGDDGLVRDPDDYGDRLHRNGALGSAEAAWIRAMHDATTAEHVFVWLHHPPDPPAPLSHDADYAAEWAALMPDLPKVRGFGGGHTHVPDDYSFAGVPAFVSPAFKNNFDLEAGTLLPPGYRRYEFATDGTISSETRLVGEDTWPRHPLGRSVMALLRAEITYAEFDEIVARRRAAPD